LVLYYSGSFPSCCFHTACCNRFFGAEHAPMPAWLEAVLVHWARVHCAPTPYALPAPPTRLPLSLHGLPSADVDNALRGRAHGLLLGLHIPVCCCCRCATYHRPDTLVDYLKPPPHPTPPPNNYLHRRTCWLRRPTPTPPTPLNLPQQDIHLLLCLQPCLHTFPDTPLGVLPPHHTATDSLPL